MSTALELAVPIGLAGLGGLWAERAGVVNIGLEGMMILGTWFGAWAGYQWGPWVGIVFGIIGGCARRLLHAIATVTFNVNHIVSGVAINILALGTTRYLAKFTFARASEGGSAKQSPPVDSLGTFDGPRAVRAGWTPQREALVPDLGPRRPARRSGHRPLPADRHRGRADPGHLVGPVAHRLRPAPALLRREPGRGRVARRQRLQVQVHRRDHLRRLRRPRRRLPVDRRQRLPGGQTGGRGYIGLAAMIFGNWMPGGLALGAGLFGYTDSLNLRGGAENVHALLLLGAILLAIGAAGCWSGRSATCPAVITAVIGGPDVRLVRLTDEVPNQVVGATRTSSRCWCSRCPRSGCGCRRRTACRTGRDRASDLARRRSGRPSTGTSCGRRPGRPCPVRTPRTRAIPVGVAALVDDGRTVSGCNVENASYGLGLCAECGLVSELQRTGGGRLTHFTCVDGKGEILVPCGRCRQLLYEFGGPGCSWRHRRGSCRSRRCSRRPSGRTISPSNSRTAP
jgi:hypothetical protein